tara:strand:+ start:16940 stop:18373 length:1434 start_codon:yes stop_codon:yes gene_type:complete
MQIIFGRLVQFIGSFIVLKSLLTIFDSESYAEINIFILISSLVILVSISPIGVYFMRFSKKWLSENILKNKLDMIIFLSFLICLFLLFLSLISLFFFPSINNVYYLFSLYIFSSAITQTLISGLGINNSVSKSILFSNLNIFGSLLFSLFSIYFFGTTIFSWILGQVSFQFILILILLKYFYKFNFSLNISLIIFKEFIQDVRNFAWTTSITNVLNWLLYQLPRILLAYYMGLEAFGFFVAGYMIAAYLFAGLEAVLNSYFLTNFYRKCEKEENSNAWSEYFFYILIFSIIFLTLFIFVSGLLSRIIISDNYLESMNFIYFGLACEFLRLVGSTFIIAGQFLVKPEITFKPMTFSIIIMLTGLLLSNFLYGFNFILSLIIIFGSLFSYQIFSYFLIVKNYSKLDIRIYFNDIILMTSISACFLISYFIAAQLVSFSFINILFIDVMFLIFFLLSVIKILKVKIFKEINIWKLFSNYD